MATTDPRGLRGLPPLVVLSLVVVMVAWGLARGWWPSNIHNGLLALTFSVVASYVLFQRPWHREGLLFMAAGAAEGVMFVGRQIGHSPSPDSGRWWGWLGVWPLVIALALCTFAVICFPDGHLPSARWRWVAAAMVAISIFCAVLSAIWPVEYAAAGVVTRHPINASTPDSVAGVWASIAHPAYIGFQILWVVAVAVRWHSADGRVRSQLAWMVAAAAVSVSVLILGLAISGSPGPGLLSATLLPIAAGWSIVRGQHVAAYRAVTWLSHAGPESVDLAADLTAAVADALTASSVVLWMNVDGNLHAVGGWPDVGVAIPPTDLESLRRSPKHQVREVRSQGTLLGALSIGRDRSDELPLVEQKLFSDLAAQATLVIRHLSLGDVISRQQRAGQLEGLTPREKDVIELMALGLSNAAIGRQLHLSIKTVEPVVGTIFAKLDLHADANSNRRVLAVLAFVRT